MIKALYQPFWLLSNDVGEGINPLVLRREAGPTLPVFSFEEEAILYRLFRASLSGLRTVPVPPGELASFFLSGPCSRVEHVALDPLPEADGEAAVALVTLSREAFLEMLARRFARPGCHGRDRPGEYPRGVL